MVKKSVNKDCGTVASDKKNFLRGAQFIGMVDTKIESFTIQSPQSEPKYLHVLLARQVVRMI